MRDHLISKLRRDELAAESARAVDEAIVSSRLDGHRSAEGDAARLRGIPVIGAASGAILGTQPEQEVCR